MGMSTRRANPFTEHPASVGETYLEHLRVAAGFGFEMIAAGFACLVHALLPFLFVRTGSDCILRLHDRMLARRQAAQSHTVQSQTTQPKPSQKTSQPRFEQLSQARK
jgi:hypothetical protein